VVAERDAVIYLDVDDEITSAAARIRAVDARRVAVVVPPGSRIATSRINFRLLAREALAQGRRLAVVAPDAPSRALAASAGLPVFGSVGEFESADDRPAAEDATAAAVSASGAVAAEAPPDEGTILIPPVPGEGVGSGPAPVSRETAAPATLTRPVDVPVAGRDIRARRRRLRLVPIVAALALLVLLAGGVVAYVLLPSASVVVTPRFEPVGPVSFVVRADPSATAIDAANGVIPANRLSFDLSATGTFDATGVRTEQSAASGTVRWTNCDPTASYRIPAGSIVRTKSGIRFATTDAVFLPVAGINGTTLDCQSSIAGVDAAEEGPDGNVAANTITVPPSAYNSNVIHVTNPQPTAGGERKTFPQVTKKDVDGAQSALRKQLGSELDAKLGEPDAVPGGTTIFPATKKLSAAQPDIDPASLVGDEQPSFELTMTATGTVVAVDESPLDQIAAQRLAASVRPDRTLVADSLKAATGKPTISGEIVSFPVDVSATQIARLDAGALREAIRGRSIDEARRVLEAYGAVRISTWPDWVASIPTLDQRLELTIATPTTAAPGPSGSATPSGSAAPSRSGRSSPAPSGS
jgi:hypothetical protein